MDKFVYDYIGNEYPRKNLYFLDLAEGKKVSKNQHPYIKESKIIAEKVRLFNQDLKKEVANRNFITGSDEEKLYIAQRKVKFYENYKDFSYDYQLEYRENRIKEIMLPSIIEERNQINSRIEEIEKALTNINEEEEAKISKELESFKLSQKAKFQQEKQLLIEKKQNGIISQKAYDNSIRELKLSQKADLRTFKLRSTRVKLNDELKSLKFRLKKSPYKVLRSNISDARRNTPIEVMPGLPWKTIISAPLPGLGQLLNGQFIKSILFFLSSLFVYLIAVPYALGIGNYQGNGISGLIDLAANAGKLSRSLIFMIEGVIALVLMAFALAIVLASIKDVYSVEKGKHKGIRHNTWNETRARIESDGFPYLVTIPSLIMISFIVVVPVMTTVLLSFAGMDPKHQAKFSWTGFSNYMTIIKGEGLAGEVFWKILGWTLIWTICATTVAIAIGFFLAIIANNERIKGKQIFRIIFLLPWAVPAFITIMFFSIMLSPTGPITDFLKNTFGIVGSVKQDPFMTRVALILIQGWLGSAYVFLLTTGVLQAIPGDLYEAAQIDGATEWQKLTKITVPLVLFQTAPLLITQYTFNFNNFSIIQLFNQGGPFNPTEYGNLSGSSDLLISYVFKLTLDNQYHSIGAAITIVISLALMVFAFIGFTNSKAFKEGKL